MKQVQAAPMGKTHRISSESTWPLRNEQGLTFAEAKAQRIKTQNKRGK